MTEFMNGFNPVLINLGFVILGYSFCKYRQKLKEIQSVANNVKQTELANNMKADIKILNPARDTTTNLLNRLEKNIVFASLMIIWIVHNFSANEITQIIFYAFAIILFALDAWQRGKIIKELRSRYTEFSNKSSEPT
jgi:hypothetical protein